MSELADVGSPSAEINGVTGSFRIRWRRLLPYAIALPIILYEGLLIVYPIAQGIYGSFTRIELASDSPTVWIGLDNYRRMFADPAFWQVIQTTLIFTALVIRCV